MEVYKPITTDKTVTLIKDWQNPEGGRIFTAGHGLEVRPLTRKKLRYSSRKPLLPGKSSRVVRSTTIEPPMFYGCDRNDEFCVEIATDVLTIGLCRVESSPPFMCRYSPLLHAPS